MIHCPSNRLSVVRRLAPMLPSMASAILLPRLPPRRRASSIHGDWVYVHVPARHASTTASLNSPSLSAGQADSPREPNRRDYWSESGVYSVLATQFLAAGVHPWL